VALEATARGGTVVLAGIHMSDIPSMTYAEHLFLERDLRTVTANTRADGDEFLRLARTLDLRPTATPYGFDRAAEAVDDLRSGRASGSLVLVRDA
jgi:propanol-preferring alcohol dehydrogenase